MSYAQKIHMFNYVELRLSFVTTFTLFIHGIWVSCLGSDGSKPFIKICIYRKYVLTSLNTTYTIVMSLYAQSLNPLSQSAAHIWYLLWCVWCDLFLKIDFWKIDFWKIDFLLFYHILHILYYHNHYHHHRHHHHRTHPRRCPNRRNW